MNYLFQPLSIFLTSTTSTTPNISNVSDSVIDISEAISKYGVAVVIMAVFFVIFMILIVIMLYSNTKMINQIMTSKSDSEKQDQQLISKFVDSALDAKGIKDSDKIVSTLTNELKESLLPLEQAVKHITEGSNNDDKDDDYHKDLVGAYIDINMAFKDISRSTMNTLNCDRVAIYIFHNGNKSMHGLPFFKMSCIHEWTSHGNNTLRGKSHMDMPLHLFNDFIENLYTYGVYKAQDVDKSAENDPSIKEFTAFSNAKSIYLVAMRDNDETLAGFVAAEFSHVETFENDPERDKNIKEIMDNMISKISPIVTNKYIFKYNDK